MREGRKALSILPSLCFLSHFFSVTHSDTHTHARAHTHTHTHTNTHNNTPHNTTNTNTTTHTHSLTHTHTHTHTHSQAEIAVHDRCHRWLLMHGRPRLKYGVELFFVLLSTTICMCNNLHTMLLG